MISVEYANAYSEVLEILKYISKEDYEKIPNSKIELFETNYNKDYIFKYNPNKTLDEQNVSKTAKAIIAILFRDYWATEIQKEKIISKQNYDRMKFEEERKVRYNSNNLFKNEKRIIMDNTEKEEELALIETSDIKWYKKVWRFLTKFFILESNIDYEILFDFS